MEMQGLHEEGLHAAAVVMRISASTTKMVSAHIRGEQRQAVRLFFFARPLNLAAMFFCAPAQKHKIGNTSSQ